MEKQYLFKKADEDEVVETDQLFDELIEELDKGINYPKWTRGVYPNLDYLKSKQKLGELYILKDNEKIVGAAVLNHDQVKEYEKVDWTIHTRPDETLIMHSFAVKKDLRNTGIGSIFIRKIIEMAQDENLKAIHFDTIFGNEPARAFYSKNGFNYLGLYELHYDETDEIRFHLYEMNL